MSATITTSRSFLGLSIPQHTPGPWSLGASYDSNPHGEFDVFGAEYGHYATGRVAVVERRAGGAYLADSVSPHAQRLTAEANARLIASAPELLDALKGAVGYAELEGGFCEPPYWYTDAKNAIAKAQGHQ